ncbi:hypothetical protein B4096_3726 [Heyndrickxia coagulans]|nr:hypothetical protein B4096_3726 [Heyndrickxia coagulans]
MLVKKNIIGTFAFITNVFLFLYKNTTCCKEDFFTNLLM